MTALTKVANKLSGARAMMAFDNGWQLVLNRLLFRSTADLYRIGGVSFIVDHAGGDACGTKSCIASDMYRQYLPALSLGQTISVLDLGANGGGFPILLHSLGFRFRRLVCVEMNPNTYTRLSYNISSNFPEVSRCLNVALADREGELELALGAGSTGDSIFQSGIPETGRRYRIRCATLDEVIGSEFNGEIDLVKMDIEGAEYGVLLDGGESIARARYLVMEIHDHRLGKEVLIRRLESLGFREILNGRKAHDDVYCFANVRLSEEGRDVR